MKRGHVAFASLLAVVALALFGMYLVLHSPTALVVEPQFTEQQTDCLMGCYNDLRNDDLAGLPLSRHKLASCISYCQKN